jgi:phosphoribosylanthranilate isomerase
LNYLCKIKLSGVGNLSDARYAAAMGIHYISFCFDPANPAYIAPVKAAEIMGWTSGSEAIGSFGEQSKEEISDICEMLKLDMVEVENAIEAAQLISFERPIIKTIDVSGMNENEVETIIEKYRATCYAFQLKAEKYPFSNSFLSKLCSEVKIIADINFHISNTAAFIREVKPYAISLQAGSEEKTGLRDFDELADLLESIQVEEA